MLLRLNADGSPDKTFVPGFLSGYGMVCAMAANRDGTLVTAGGQFSSLSGTSRTALAQVYTVAQPVLELNLPVSGEGFRFLLNGEAGRDYRIDSSINLLDWLPLGAVSLTNSAAPFVDSSGGSFGRRFYRAVVVP